MNRYWTLVVVAGLMEILWAIGLKHSESLIAWAGTFGLIIVSFFVLIKAVEKVPVATAYAVFTGIGTAGTSLADIVIFREAFSWTKMIFVLMLLIGVMGLKLVTAEADEREGEA